MNKENIFPLAIGTYGLGAKRCESWEDNNNELVEFFNVIFKNESISTL